MTNRATITPDAFADLVNGKPVTLAGVSEPCEVILADVGFSEMAKAVTDAAGVEGLQPFKLFEITTNRTGESYERGYVWAPGLSLAVERFEHRHPKATVGQVRELFAANADSFVSALSDHGFYME